MKKPSKNRYYLVQMRLHDKLTFRRVKAKSEKYLKMKLSKLFPVSKDEILPVELPKEIFRWDENLIINL